MTVPLPEEQSLPPLPSLPASLRKQVYTHSSAISSSFPQSYDLLLQLGNSVLHLVLTRTLIQHPSCRDSRLLNNIREQYFGRENIEKWGIQYGMLQKVQVSGGTILEQEGREGKREKGIAGDCFIAYIGALDSLSYSSLERSDDSTYGSDNSVPDSPTSTHTSVAQDSIRVQLHDIATTFILSLITPTLDSKIKHHLESSAPCNKSALAILNEKLSQRGMDFNQQRKKWSHTEHVGKEYLDSPKRFTAKFKMGTKDIVTGEGRNLKEAKARVAEEILKREEFGAGRGGN